MKIFIRLSIVFISSILIVSCTGSMTQLPQKYALDTRLKQVKSIYKYGLSQWKAFNDQSLIIETSTGSYYLIVLKRPSPELSLHKTITLSSSGDMIRAGADDVIIDNGPRIRLIYPIDQIYQITDEELMRALKDQFTDGKHDRRMNIEANI
jgi:hypothetical protein